MEPSEIIQRIKCIAFDHLVEKCHRSDHAGCWFRVVRLVSQLDDDSAELYPSVGFRPVFAGLPEGLVGRLPDTASPIAASGPGRSSSRVYPYGPEHNHDNDVTASTGHHDYGSPGSTGAARRVVQLWEQLDLGLHNQP